MSDVELPRTGTGWSGRCCGLHRTEATMLDEPNLDLADHDLPEPNGPTAEILAAKLNVSVDQAANLLMRYVDDLDTLMRNVAKIVWGAGQRGTTLGCCYLPDFRSSSANTISNTPLLSSSNSSAGMSAFAPATISWSARSLAETGPSFALATFSCNHWSAKRAARGLMGTQKHCDEPSALTIEIRRNIRTRPAFPRSTPRHRHDCAFPRQSQVSSQS